MTVERTFAPTPCFSSSADPSTFSVPSQTFYSCQRKFFQKKSQLSEFSGLTHTFPRLSSSYTAAASSGQSMPAHSAMVRDLCLPRHRDRLVVTLLVTLVQSSALISLTFIYRLLTLNRKAPTPTKNFLLCAAIVGIIGTTGVSLVFSSIRRNREVCT